MVGSSWKIRASVLFALAGAMGLVSASCAVAAPLYGVTGLGFLPGYEVRSVANGINNLGQVVGTSTGATDADGITDNRGFFWTPGGGLQNIGVLPGHNLSAANDINDAGVVVGESAHVVPAPATGNERAFRWTAGGGFQPLSGLTGSTGDAFALSINNAGQVAGGSPAPSGTGRHAVLWGAGGTVHDLGQFPAPDPDTIANSVNNLGHVSGNTETNLSPSAFLWTGGPLQEIGTHGQINVAGRMNDLDQVPLTTGPNLGDMRGVIWTAGTLLELGTLPDGTPISPQDISNNGIVVGTTVGNTRAFVWTTGTGARDLNDLIDPSLGWTLRAATALNEQGQIVGFGSFGGKDEAFLLTPISAVPLPPTLPLMAGALAALGLLRRRKAAA